LAAPTHAAASRHSTQLLLAVLAHSFIDTDHLASPASFISARYHAAAGGIARYWRPADELAQG